MLNGKLAVFFNLFFIINSFHRINSEIKDNGCQDWNEILQNQNMTEVTKDLYRFHKDEVYSIYLGSDPLTVWMNLEGETMFSMFNKALGYPQGNNTKTFFQVYGRPDCQVMIDATQDGNSSPFRLTDNRDCFTSCPRFHGKYTPVTMWSENGPVEVKNMISKYDLYPLKLYLPETQMAEFAAVKPCKLTTWMETAFPTSDYSHLKTDSNEVFKNESGISSVRLNNDGYTAVWVEIKDSSPEHFVIIQLEDGNQTIEEDFVVGLEANGLHPVSFDAEQNFTKLPTGIKIYLKKMFCDFNNNFLGHVRYVFNVNSTSNFTATFYDASGNNLELKYLEEEKDGIPKPYSERFQFEYFPITPESVTTTNSLTSALTSTTTTTQHSTKEESEDAGMSVPMLIGIIFGGLLGVLLLFCIIVICALRSYRSRKRNQQNAIPEYESLTDEVAAQERRSIWQKLIIFLIGPAPRSSKRQASSNQMPSSSAVPPESSQSFQLVPIVVPKTVESKASNVTKQSTHVSIPVAIPAPTPGATPASTPAETPASELPLQKTQPSDSEKLWTETQRAAKYEKRDPRFSHLVPGTIEFIVAKGHADARTDTDDDYTRSGPRDGPEVAKYVNPH